MQQTQTMRFPDRAPRGWAAACHHSVPVWLLCLAVTLLPGLWPRVAAGENWPGWRGPRSDGTSVETDVPTQWDGPSGRNILWKTAIPGRGLASPIVWQDRLFVVSCREQSLRRVLLCLDAMEGRILWEQVVLEAPLEKKHTLNSYASSTPATDGRLVFVSFLEPDFGADQLAEHPGRRDATPGQMVVAAYDFEGRRRWLARPGRFASMHGFCSPPLLFENLVIVNGDHDGDSYLVALDKATGRTVWKTPRKNKTRSYCPPIIRQAAGRLQMVLSGDRCVASYDPRTGELIWMFDGPTEQYVASLVYNGKYFFMTAGFPEHHIMAFRPDGTGHLTDSAVVWHTTRGCAYVPSPIIAGEGKYFLVVSDTGAASCFDAETGRRCWMERVGTHYSASLVEAEGLVHFLADDGITTIVRPGEQFEVVAENRLGENCYASPAISGQRIFFRAEEHVYCVGRPGPTQP